MATGDFKVGLLQEALGTKSVAGSANVNLSTAEAKVGFLHLTGAITASISVIVPAALLEAGNSWVVYNNTTGTFTLTFKGASGSGVVITQGKRVEVYFDGTNMVPVQTDLAAQSAAGVISVNVADSSAIANTAVETNFSLNTVLAPDFLTAGKVIRVTVAGKYSNTGTPTLRFRLKMGSTVLLDLGAVTLPSGATDHLWRMIIVLVCRATGSSGSIQASSVSALIASGDDFVVPVIATLNTTIAQTLQLSAEWSAASASNTVTQQLMLVEALN